jgi:hypothetical protein
MDDPQVIYLTKDFIPTTPEKADLVKLIYADGRVVFAKPAKEAEAPPKIK